MQAALDKYEAYPEDVAAARDALAVKMKSEVADLTAKLSTLLGSDDIQVIFSV